MSVPVFASVYANLHGEHGVPPDIEEKMAKEHIAELIAEFLLRKGFIQFDFTDGYPHRDGTLRGVLCVRRPLGDDEVIKRGEALDPRGLIAKDFMKVEWQQ